MKTYQDLLAVGADEKARMSFCLAAISEHESSDQYKIARDAEEYFRHRNPRIMRLQKIIYDVLGRAQVDPLAVNHKILSRYYFYFVNQEVQYLLGNGLTFSDPKTKEMLGKSFDGDLQELTVRAINGGAAFGYWNVDHIEVLPLCGVDGGVAFVPLYDEITGTLSAGIRYFQIDATKPLQITLFEIDGFTMYARNKGDDIKVVQEKRKYKQIVSRSEATGVQVIEGENYDGFPIVPLYNINKQSELVGSRNTIDAYDLMLSGLVNNVDEGNLIYWIIQNAGGMTDADDQRFVERLRTLHVVHTDDSEQVTSHSVEASFQPSEAALEQLRTRLFEDFMALDVQKIQGGATTATQIRAAYEPMLIKSNLLETQVSRFVNGILKMIGVDDEPLYNRDSNANKSEEIQTLMAAAQYLPDEYVTKKILAIFGDVDAFDEVMAQKIDTDVERMTEYEAE